MGFSPRMYEIHLYLQDESGDWWWEHKFTYRDLTEASKWYGHYKDVSMDVRIVETKIVKAFEDGKEYS